MAEKRRQKVGEERKEEKNFVHLSINGSTKTVKKKVPKVARKKVNHLSAYLLRRWLALPRSRLL